MTTYQPLVAADYARTVTFEDPLNRADDGTDWPIHCIGSRKMRQLDVLIDGDLIPGVMDFGIEYGRERATVVTLHINPDMCDVGGPFFPSDKSWAVPGAIGDHAVLSPRRETSHDDDMGSWVYDLKTHTIACTMFAARVVFE